MLQQLLVRISLALKPLALERVIADILSVTTDAVANGTYDEKELHLHIAYLTHLAEMAGRQDELERIQKNTLDADSDVWSQDDSGGLTSLTDRYNYLRSRL
jgi:hypothetical protein